MYQLLYKIGVIMEVNELKSSEEIVLSPVCNMCGKTKKLKVNKDDYLRWNSGELIQNCFPYLSADQREILISGFCGECFENIFS